MIKSSKSERAQPRVHETTLEQLKISRKCRSHSTDVMYLIFWSNKQQV